VLSGKTYKYIPIENALMDLLREYNITLNDLLDAMIVEGLDVYEELIKRINNPSKDLIATIYLQPWRVIGLTLFVLQAFYIINVSGLYKGYFLDPPREKIMNGSKVSHTGVILLINRLKHLV
jgi:hypothetical protein